MKTSRLTELAWAAGLFDGEGSTYLSYANTHRYSNPIIKVSISQSYSPEVLIRFQAAVRVGKIYGPFKGKENPYWRYQATCNKAFRMLYLIWPYLSSVKRQQAKKAISLFGAKRAAHRKKLIQLGTTPRIVPIRYKLI